MQRYIGTRDFYPATMKFRNWLFAKQRQVCESFGYQEYGAPVVEYMEIYRNKTSNEIVNEQIYNFFDRKNREIAIRPEMTPTLARMAMAKIRQFPVPLRWYSIANFMRYERPGHNRLREFYQLNVDLIGLQETWVDLEIIRLAIAILQGYQAQAGQFILYYSDRRLIYSMLSNKNDKNEVMRLLDKKDKMSSQKFQENLKLLVPDNQEREKLQKIIASKNPLEELSSCENHENANIIAEIRCLAQGLTEFGLADCCHFNPSLARGFDYYTGMVFEVFDCHPQNRRSIFGGGRYDSLLTKYSSDQKNAPLVPAVGFGLGDIPLESFLNSHSLNPFFSPVSATKDRSKLAGEYEFTSRSCMIVCTQPKKLWQNVVLAQRLRKMGWIVEESCGDKLSRQIKIAVQKKHEYVLILDQYEQREGEIIVRNLKTSQQFNATIQQAMSALKKCL